jgi:gas vesicle protein
MNSQKQEPRDYRFVIGLFAGALVGAGLTMWFAPNAASEIKERLTDSAKRMGKRASAQYQQATDRVGQVVDDVTRRGQDARDNVADAVARGAHEVERFANAAKTTSRG